MDRGKREEAGGLADGMGLGSGEFSARHFGRLYKDGKRFGLFVCGELLWEIGVGWFFFFDIARWA